MEDYRQKQRLSVIIPLLNEEQNVVLVYRRTKETLDRLAFPYEIIFIDDGSTDNTYQVLKSLKAKDEKLIIIKFAKNFGQTAAFAAGFKVASGDMAITMDGDLQCDPQDIVLFLDLIIKEADVVCGWRKINNLSILIKRSPSLIANFFGAFMFGINIHDFSCTFRAHKKSFYKKVYLAEGFHRFVPILAKFEGMVIKEIKINYSLRNRGASKYTFLRFPKVIKDAILLKIIDIFFNKSCDYLFKKTSFVIDNILV